MGGVVAAPFGGPIRADGSEDRGGDGCSDIVTRYDGDGA